MLKIEESPAGVYRLIFDRPGDVALACYRCAQFYESPDPNIRNRSFLWQQAIASDMRRKSTDAKLVWSFPDDWHGFNFPASTIAQVIAAGIPDRTHWDDLLAGVLGMVDHPHAYVIATSAGDNATLDHELTHAMFFQRLAYRDRVHAIIDAHATASRAMRKRLIKWGYANDAYILDDEINAYVATGEPPELRAVSGASARALRRELRAAWRENWDSWRGR